MGVGTGALDEGFGLPGRWNRLRVDARGLYPSRVTWAGDSHTDAGAGECTTGGGVCGVGGRSDALARTRRVTENKVVEGGRNGKVLESAPRATPRAVWERTESVGPACSHTRDPRGHAPASDWPPVRGRRCRCHGTGTGSWAPVLAISVASMDGRLERGAGGGGQATSARA